MFEFYPKLASQFWDLSILISFKKNLVYFGMFDIFEVACDRVVALEKVTIEVFSGSFTVCLVSSSRRNTVLMLYI